MAPVDGNSPSGGELAGLGAAIAGAMVVPVVAGVLIDGALRTSPVFVLIGVALGIVGATATAFIRIKRYL